MLASVRAFGAEVPEVAPPAVPATAEVKPDAEPADIDAVDADDAIGIKEDVNEGKAEMEALLKAETKVFDHPDSVPKNLNRFGPGNPLHELIDANRDDRSATSAPMTDAGGLLPELNGIDLAALKSEYDIPVEINDDVVEYIRFFQGPGRKWYEKWLARAHRWIPLMRPILAQEGVPLDLVYLAMIESGFSPFAFSWASASGFWQFIRETGKRYGLRDDFWVDERRDPVLSTRAAARHLKYLHDDLGDWYLAWASYNAGEGKVHKAMKQCDSRDFWQLAHAHRALKPETQHYVPKLIAAALIAKHPDRFGFTNIEEEGPFAFDEVDVPDATDLQVVARSAGVPMDALQQMNPSLRRWCTPPAREGHGYRIKVPPGTKESFESEFERIEPTDRLTFRYHRVTPGENIAAIAKHYATDSTGILRMNGLDDAKHLKKGADLIIPVSTAVAQKFPDNVTAWSEPHAPRHGRKGAQGNHVRTVAAEPPPSSGKYVVRNGDTLWSIARRFGVGVDEIQQWNNMGAHSARGLQIGRTIRVAPAKNASAATRGRG